MHRKIRDAADARRCLEAAATSGLDRVEWARRHGVDARSLNAWRVNLSRRAEVKPLRLVELVAPPGQSAGRYVLHVGELSIELDDAFREDTLERLLRVVAGC
mgnify:FL=1